MTKNTLPKIQITIRIDPSLRGAIDHLASEYELTASAYLRRLVKLAVIKKANGDDILSEYPLEASKSFVDPRIV